MALKARAASLIIISCMILGTITTFVPEKTVGTVVATLYVGGSGTGNYTTIQSAINSSSSGDTVFVYSGTYYENVVIDKSITLIGEDKNTTAIDGGGNGNVVYVSSDWVTINGFTIQIGGNASMLLWGHNNTVMDNILTNGGHIRLSFSTYTTIMDNILTNGCYIWLYESSNNIIQGNTITQSDVGIPLFYSNNNTIQGNTITNSNIGILTLSSSSNDITSNTIRNNTNGIYCDYYCNDNTITGNTITNNIRCGIYFTRSSNNTITGNTITYNANEGVNLSDSSGNIIYHNNFIYNSVHAITFSGGENTWDNGYPRGGNYWDTYTGIDVNGDHIGDTPYVIGANNSDRYPLMVPYNLPPSEDDDSNGGTPGFEMVLVVIAAISLLTVIRKRI